MLGLLLGVTLANLATRLHSCNLFALIPVQYLIIPSWLLLLRRRLSVSARTLAVSCVFGFPVFFPELTFPTRVCWIISLRVFLEDLFVFPSGLFFPAYLTSRDQVYVRVFLPVRGSFCSQFWTLP